MNQKRTTIIFQKARLAGLLPALLLLAGIASGLDTTAQPADPGWPREFKQGGKQLTVYQPQVDYWHGYTNVHFRCAIAVKGVSKQEKFGVAEVDALTMVDHGARVVAVVPLKREFRFANVPAPELAQLRQAVEQLNPPRTTSLSLDRVIAYLNPAEQPVQKGVELNLDPPKIFSSTTPAILVVLMGEPEFKPVETNRTDLLFAHNTNWDLLRDTASGQYYLLNGEGWLTAPDLMKGPWTPARTLPPSLQSLPDNENWQEARARLPGKPAPAAPTVFVATEPCELILTAGSPSYQPVKGTKLLRVSNTESTLFLNSGDGKLYFLVAGRWFRGSSLNGPWSSASKDLPADFAQIPDDDAAAFVKASVPGTRDAQDAVLLASIPSNTEVSLTNATVTVSYTGQPQFETITNTAVQYAVNTSFQVFLVGGKYYCCSQGVWFTSTTAAGPWSFCASVPPAIYTIPPSHPSHNVTYVTVQSTTPTTVVYSQTSGYTGEYVAATGVLMFGAGIAVGAAIAHHNDHYYPPYPAHYSYGCGAVYHYGHGGYYYKGGAAYGPYGGAGYAAAYNPATGTYARGAYAYGPYGSAGVKTAYNPYTGGYARAAQVNTPYGSAGRVTGYNPYTGTVASGGYRSSAYGTAAAGRAYNPYTGASAAGASVSTPFGSAGRAAAYNPSTGKSAVGGYASGQYGSAAGVRTSEGTGAASWNTANSQGKVAKTKSGDIYASNGDTVYKKDANGNWSQNSGNGWQNANKPPPPNSAMSSTASRTAARPQSSAAPQPRATSASAMSASGFQSLESQSAARQSGNQRATSASRFQASSSAGGSRSQGASRAGRSRR